MHLVCYNAHSMHVPITRTRRLTVSSSFFLFFLKILKIIPSHTIL